MKAEDKIFTKSFILIFTALLFTALVMYALMSTVTEYASSLGTSAAIAGLVSGIYIFGGLCSRIYSGNALERNGWKKTALAFMTIHFLACLLYFLARDVNLLLIVRFIHGIGFGASANAIVTIASQVLPKSAMEKHSDISCLEPQLLLESDHSSAVWPVIISDIKLHSHLQPYSQQ